MLRAQLIETRGIPFGVATLIRHLAIPYESEAFESSQDLVGAARHHTCSVEVFHAQKPATAVMAGVEVAAEGGNQRPQMQGAGGGGSEAVYVGRGRFAGPFLRGNGPRGNGPSGNGRRGRRTGAHGVRGVPALRC